MEKIESLNFFMVLCIVKYIPNLDTKNIRLPNI